MNESTYWLDQAIAYICEKIPTGKIITSSGISPSAEYHIGHFREILTVEAITWGLKEAGREAQHIHVVDNFDPLRKRYPFLPEEFEKYVGWPVALIPDPVGDCHPTYADHYYSTFEKYIHILGIEPTVVKSYEDLYSTGRMTERFEDVLTHLPQIYKIFKDVSNRDLEENWTPIQVLGDDNRYFNATADSWNKENQTIAGKSYAKGQAKLNWRLDWPARWRELGVDVEPFGRELASAGSAYQTGVKFAREVFDIEPPLPVAKYEPIHLPGDTKKMSSSLGNLITPKEALEIMPPEVLRYFVVRSRPERKLHFDSGIGLFNLLDEYTKVKETISQGGESEFGEAFRFANSVNKIQDSEVITSVPFNHLVSIYQTVSGDAKKAAEALKRSDYHVDTKILDREFSFVKNWLEKYAPENIKFEIQQVLPQVDLTAQQKIFIGELVKSLETIKQPDGPTMHKLIYAAKDAAGIETKEAFQTLYMLILNQDSGPKAGWFLASLDQDWLSARLKLIT